MKKLIFFPSVTGHNLEFIHHLYMGYVDSQEEAIFVLPERYNEQKKLLDWPSCDRITFDLMSMEEMGQVYPSARKKAKLLHKYMRKNNVHEAFLSDIMGMMPYLPFYLGRRDHVYGLTFGIYLYRWKTRARWKNLIEGTFHWMMSRCHSIRRIYVGNDTSAPLYFNKLFHTDKYLYCPDPFNKQDVSYRDLRAEYKIPSDRWIMYHFGSMGGRKGTDYILRSILYMSQEVRKNYCFVFAGIVQEKEKFYDYLKQINDNNVVLVFDKFCEFDFIQQWCMCCDAILIPYSQTHLSSGIIGYAAQYKKPVIGPSSGLIGKLIRRNHLGVVLDDFSSTSMLKAYNDVCNWTPLGNNYIERNSVKSFNDIVINDR